MKKVLQILLVLGLAMSLFAGGSKESDEVKLAWYAATAHPYFDDVEVGVNKFIAEEQDVEVRILYGPDWEQTSQDQNLRALVADGYTGISTYPNSGGAANIFSELVNAAGVNAIGFGAQSGNSNSAEQFCVATDVYQAAYDATQAVIDAMGGKGGILNVLEVISDPNTQQRQKAVAACVADNPGVEMIQEIADINNIDIGKEKIEAALAASQGEIQGIICTGNITSDATASVLENYYKINPNAEKIYAIGIDVADTVMNAIRDDVMFATIAQNTTAHGYVPLKLLQLMGEGYTKVPGTYFIDSGTVVVTKENIDTYEADVAVLLDSIVADLTVKYVTK